MNPGSAADPFLVVEGSGERKVLVRDVPLTIGTDRRNWLRLAAPEAAPVHCRIQWSETGVFVDCLAPETMRVNEEVLPVGERRRLRHEDALMIGCDSLLFRWTSESAEGHALSKDVSARHSTIDETDPEESVLGATTRIQVDGIACQAIALDENRSLVIGNGDGCDAQLFCEAYASLPPGRFAVHVEPTHEGFLVSDRGTACARLNGRAFEAEILTAGDRLEIKPFVFQFSGRGLVWERREDVSGSIRAIGLTVRRGGNTILQNLDFQADGGEFVAVIGRSGSGKTTLIRALAGLQPLTDGRIWVDGIELKTPDGLDAIPLGYVPQDDIVHTALKVRDALRFSAELRLPLSTPPVERRRQIDRTADELGLTPLLDRRIAEPSGGGLSGGQRKRVSIAVELLSRPEILFLDEPTSGLDPEMEAEVMAVLRTCSERKCTVICTTHVMENLHTVDRVAVVGGKRCVFQGSPSDMRRHFGIQKLGVVYQRLEEKPPEHWQQEPVVEKLPEFRETSPKPRKGPRPLPLFRRQVGVLLKREGALLQADPKSILLLVGQPLIIGLLLNLVATTATDVGTKLFLAGIVALWFGCNNASAQIVREKDIFRREKHVGLGVHAYLGAKFTLWSVISALQATLLLAVVRLITFGGIGGASSSHGDWLWQWLAVAGAALAGTAIGFVISAWAKETAQAALVVPLVIIPQILLAGYVFELDEWFHSESRHARAAAWAGAATPSFAAQRLMETSLHSVEDDHGDNARENLGVWLNENFKPGYHAMAGDAQRRRIVRVSLSTLAVWLLLGYGATYFLVRKL